jgi:hypothetical protein
MLGIRRGDLGTYFRRSQFEPLVSTILDDPVLADVPKNATVSDIDTLIGVELGSAMKLSILKLDGTQFGMCVVICAFLSILGSFGAHRDGGGDFVAANRWVYQANPVEFRMPIEIWELFDSVCLLNILQFLQTIGIIEKKPWSVFPVPNSDKHLRAQYLPKPFGF